jgi:hypothetical protein
VRYPRLDQRLPWSLRIAGCTRQVHTYLVIVLHKRETF